MAEAQKILNFILLRSLFIHASEKLNFKFQKGQNLFEKERNFDK